MELLDFIREEKGYVEQELLLYFKNLIRNESDFFLKDFYGKLRNFIIPNRGPAKRLRPMITIYTFFGLAPDIKVEEYLEEIRRISISIELLHNASLIFEDVSDNESNRRGLPTFHKLIEESLSKRNENPFGNVNKLSNNIAMQGCDLVSSLGAQIIMNSKFEEKLKYQALRAYFQGNDALMQGKVIEFYLMTNSLEKSSLEDYLIMAESKMASQFIAAAEIGALITDARRTQILPLKDAMKQIGVCYQILRDIEDSFGDPKLKSIDLDIKSRKRNILMISACNNSSGKDKKDFKKIMESNTEMTPDDIQRVREIIKESGAIDFAKVYSANLLSQAKIKIDQIYPGMRNETYTFLNNFIDYVQKKIDV